MWCTVQGQELELERSCIMVLDCAKTMVSVNLLLEEQAFLTPWETQDICHAYRWIPVHQSMAHGTGQAVVMSYDVITQTTN